jgi:hypothetical protein
MRDGVRAIPGAIDHPRRSRGQRVKDGSCIRHSRPRKRPCWPQCKPLSDASVRARISKNLSALCARDARRSSADSESPGVIATPSRARRKQSGSLWPAGRLVPLRLLAQLVVGHGGTLSRFDGRLLVASRRGYLLPARLSGVLAQAGKPPLSACRLSFPGAFRSRATRCKACGLYATTSRRRFRSLCLLWERRENDRRNRS